MTPDFPDSLFPGAALPPPPPVRRADYLLARDAPPLSARLAKWRADAARRKAERGGAGGGTGRAK